jgi:hypothetical protein
VGIANSTSLFQLSYPNIGYEKIWEYFGKHLIKMLPGLEKLNLAKVLDILNGLPVASTEVDADSISKMRLISYSDKEIAMA